jgi:hypothetical protein
MRQSSLVALHALVLPRLTVAETGDITAQRPADYRGGWAMAVLWVLVALLIIFAIIGGVAVNNWLFLIIVIALVLALIGAF